MGLREGHYTATWKRKNPFPTAAMPSDPQPRDYPHKWHHYFLLAGGQLDFSSPNLCRIPTFGTPIPCCPADILGEFWASERCSGSGKHAGRENTNHIISEHANRARCANYHRKHRGKKRAASVCRQRRGGWILQLTGRTEEPVCIFREKWKEWNGSRQPVSQHTQQQATDFWWRRKRGV